MMQSLRFDGQTAIVTGAGGNPSLGRAHAMLLAASSPAVAFLAHRNCPVTGECIDAVGGEVQRCYITRTKGLAERDHTIETIAERWQDVMDEDGAATVGLAMMDTSGWKLRTYASNDV